MGTLSRLHTILCIHIKNVWHPYLKFKLCTLKHLKTQRKDGRNLGFIVVRIILAGHHQQWNKRVPIWEWVIKALPYVDLITPPSPHIFVNLWWSKALAFQCDVQQNPSIWTYENFTWLVANVASIEIAPLWPHKIIDCNCMGVWIPIVNGTWTPFISLTSWK
jgi:hypothetical protein